MMSVLTKDQRFEDANQIGSDGEEMCTMSDVLDRIIEEATAEKVQAAQREGMKNGQIVAFAQLVRDGLLSLADAAAKAGLTVEGFSHDAKSLGYPV